MTVHWSLGYFRETGHGVLALCDKCRHTAQLPIDKLIETFGADFVIPNDRSRFMATLSCSSCGSRDVSIQITLPGEAKGYRG